MLAEHTTFAPCNMEAGESLICAKIPAAGSYSEPIESCLLPHIQFL
jgi:hypothetical protein